ncbi:hypothetical protein FHS15_005626 [Paenibacillus castaneae]|uniref:DUF4855 domain-containing protein n=1 Tax=Paenibacillus castaneae TaxID=474957 RepID=UPI000C9CA7AF|nr:DUF4855 domain-containing protein [Paenibacillus castaneae]NIK80436.1 hypothetical protein [Paenibacillus castaneae]
MTTELRLQGYLPPGSEKTAGAEHIMLVYYGHYDKRGDDKQLYGDWSKEKFLPYVAYLNKAGEPQDDLFDTFLFLALKSPGRGSFHRYYDWELDSEPGKMSDWKWAIDRLFEEERQLFALNEAAAEIGAKLNVPNKKIKVMTMIPFPERRCKQFGDLSGKGIIESLESLENRNKAIQWYVDLYLSKFHQAEFSNLEFVGFYWMQEDVEPDEPGEIENIQFTLHYLHKRNLKLGWLPWWGAKHKGDGAKFGFDFTIVQPNHYFQEQSTAERIQDCAELASKTNQGIQIEFDTKVISSQWHRRALYQYLKGGIEFGYMNHSVLAFYQDVQALYELYHDVGDQGRKVYDDFYLFIKGKFGQSLNLFREE